MAFGRPRKLFTEAELYDYAIGALARRMRSVAELKRLLRNRVEADTEFGKTLVELIVVRLKDQGYLNDAKYAAAFSSYRRDNEKFGRLRVVNDLKAKGVHGDVIERERRKSGPRLPPPQTPAKAQGQRPEADSPHLPPADARRLRIKNHLHHPEKMGRGRGDSHRTRERDF